MWACHCPVYTPSSCMSGPGVPPCSGASPLTTCVPSARYSGRSSRSPPCWRRALERHGARRIIDLCSGGSGPTIKLAETIQARLGLTPEVVLTDLYPNLEAFAWSQARALVPVSYERSPVDALAVPEHLLGVRTVFDAFHHFRPADARALLADAARKRAPILIVEATQRSVPAMVGMLLFVPLLVLLLTPFVRPFSWGRLLFTYLLPVAVPLILFDGIVSCLRSYTPQELRAMTESSPAVRR